MRLIDNRSRVTFGTKLSDHIYEDTNGQLICRDAVIARTGSYDYLESEIIPGGDRNKIVKVFRTDDEVFNPIAVASFENKPFVNDHPQEDVSLDNFKELCKGYMRDVKRGENEFSNCLLCDIVVTDPETIELIKSGDKRELSLGYDTEIVKRDGKYVMTNIRGNHLALVDSGRAGCATIRDSANGSIKSGGLCMKKSRSKVTLFDDDIYEVEELDDDSVGTELPVDENIEVEEIKDDVPTLADIFNLLQKIDAKLPEIAKETDEDVSEEKVAEEIKEEDLEDDDEEIEETTEEEYGLYDADGCPVKSKDSKSVYKKFAKVSDRSANAVEDVSIAFQNMYNKIAKKSN